MANQLTQLIHADWGGIGAKMADLAQEAAILPASSGHSGGEPGTGFADSFKAALQGVDDKEHAAADRMAAVDSGQSDDLVGAMLASQEASLSFSMLTQVRNKVMGAVDDLIKMQL